jgi:putative glutamine amidotransferase
MRKRPVVGIEPSVQAPDGKPAQIAMSTEYSSAVYRAGGIPVVLAPPLRGEATADELLDSVDALLYTGGPDFRTERLGLGPTHPAARPGLTAKQDFDVTLARRALERDLPVLGVCYGMQLLGILAGSNLIQHLDAERLSPSVRHIVPSGPVRHDIIAEPGTLVGKALGGAGRLSCCSSHHQAITDPGPGWRVSARADDGVVEAIESVIHRFAVGVQWHPEREDAGTPHEGLFTALVAAVLRDCVTRRRGRPSSAGPGGAPWA